MLCGSLAAGSPVVLVFSSAWRAEPKQTMERESGMIPPFYFPVTVRSVLTPSRISPAANANAAPIPNAVNAPKAW